jgi:hypothetical protein
MRFLLTGLSLLSLAVLGRQSWEKYKGEAVKDSALIRFYAFEGLTAETRQIPSLGTEKHPLLLDEGVMPEVVPGRFPGKTAIRLDEHSLKAKRFELDDQVFTAQMWIKINGVGTHRGNGGATNGTLMAIGVGYWDGLRITTSLPSIVPNLELGRPRGINSFGVSARAALMQGHWQHVAVSWDGKKLRCYINGKLTGQADYDTAYTDPGDAKFVIGFNGHGVGSTNFDVDQVVVHKRCLSAGEIAIWTLGELDCSPELVKSLDVIQEDGLRKEAEAAEAKISALMDDRNVSATLKTWLVCQFASASKLLERLDPTSLAANETPDFLMNLALGNILARLRYDKNLRLSREILEALLRQNLSSEDRCLVQARLMVFDFQDGNKDRAQVRLDEILGTKEISQETHYELANVLRGEKLYREARSIYAKILNDPDSPRQLRGLASLASAQTYLLSGDYESARRGFESVDGLGEAILPHHRLEARECAAESVRLSQGKPARDPEANRWRPAVPVIPALSVHVSPKGDDATGVGSKEKPLRTIQAGLDKVRQLRKDSPYQVSALVLGGGTYFMENTIVLDKEDGGTENAPFSIMAAPGEKPVLCGGFVLKGFDKVTDAKVLERVSQEAASKLVVCDLASAPIELKPEELPRAELFSQHVPLEPARWPNSGFVMTGQPFRDEDGKTTSFMHQEDQLEKWQASSDIWLNGYWTFLWASDTVKVKGVDLESKTIFLGWQPMYGVTQDRPYFAFNFLEAIDRPGEWFLDRIERKLYLYPEAGTDLSRLELSALKKPFFVLNDVNWVTIHGLVFDLSQATAMEINRGNQVRISGNTFSRLARLALKADDMTNSTFYGNDFHTLGAGGMRIFGGNRKTLEAGNNNIENNWVRDFSRLDRTYTPAILLGGCGNRLAHNLFHDSPHHAIRLEGNDHIVEYNDVHSVVYEADDQSGIDMWWNPSYQGNVMRYNFWHHIGSGHTIAGQSGIRLDDAICHVLMYSNIFFCAADGHFGAIQIHGGKDNVADNNLFVACQAALSFSTWGDDRWNSIFTDREDLKHRLYKEVNIDQPPYSTKYPWLKDLKLNNGRNFAWRNLLIRCNEVALRRGKMHEFLDTIDSKDAKAFLVGDTLESMDQAFSQQHWKQFTQISALRPIPFEEIGLYEDPNRASKPTVAEMRAITPNYKGTRK